MIIFYSNFHNAYETIVLRKTENDEFKSFQNNSVGKIMKYALRG